MKTIVVVCGFGIVMSGVLVADLQLLSIWTLMIIGMISMIFTGITLFLIENVLDEPVKVFFLVSGLILAGISLGIYVAMEIEVFYVLKVIFIVAMYIISHGFPIGSAFIGYFSMRRHLRGPAT